MVEDTTSNEKGYGVDIMSRFTRQSECWRFSRYLILEPMLWDEVVQNFTIGTITLQICTLYSLPKTLQLSHCDSGKIPQSRYHPFATWPRHLFKLFDKWVQDQQRFQPLFRGRSKASPHGEGSVEHNRG